MVRLGSARIFEPNEDRNSVSSRGAQDQAEEDENNFGHGADGFDKVDAVGAGGLAGQETAKHSEDRARDHSRHDESRRNRQSVVRTRRLRLTATVTSR